MGSIANISLNTVCSGSFKDKTTTDSGFKNICDRTVETAGIRTDRTRINCQSNLPSQGLGIDLQFSNRSALYRAPVLVFSCLWAFLQVVSDSILGCLDHGVTVLPPMLRPPEHEYQRTPLNLTGIKKPAKPYD